jgi:hypothetical protein
LLCSAKTLDLQKKQNTMTKNMGTIDKAIRIGVALIIVALFFMGKLPGIWAIALLVVALIFVATSFMSFCPLYLPLKINTNKNKTETK